MKIGYYYYSKVFNKVIKCNNLKTAEFSKILENVFRSINIGLVNEIKMLSDKMNIDIFDIIKVASSKPFGFMPFFPGPGVGALHSVRSVLLKVESREAWYEYKIYPTSSSNKCSN